MEIIPDSVRDYLAGVTPEGDRNQMLFNAVCQLRDSGCSEQEALQTVVEKAGGDGLHEREVATTVRSVFRRVRRAEPVGKRSGYAIPLVKREEKKSGYASYFRENFSEHDVPPDYDAGSGEAIPEGSTDGLDLIQALFNPGEGFCIHKAESGPDGKEHPAASAAVSRVFQYEQWMEIIDKKGGAHKIYEEGFGCYISVNPLKDNKRRLENIYDYRHFVLEFDHIPKEHQYRVIKKSKLPCAAILDSGGKSIHAIVRIQAKTETEWRRRVNFILHHFRRYGPDVSNNDPTRMTRLPGYRRRDTKNYQRILETSHGYTTYAEWEVHAIDETTDSEMDVEKMVLFDSDKDPDKLLGMRWLNRGSACVFSGQSGIGKSSFIMQMACTWALGRRFFGIKPIKPLRVLLVQAENDYGDMCEMLQGTVGGMGLSKLEVGEIKKKVVLREQAKLNGEEFIGYLAWLIDINRPDLVIVDPLLHYFGGDLSNQQDASTFLRKWLHPLVKIRKIALFLVHHTVKPSRDGSTLNRFDQAYASFGSSELVNWPREVMTLMRINEDDEFILTLSKRGKRSGMTDAHGMNADSIIIKHASGRIYWEQSEKVLADLVKEKEKEKKSSKKEVREPKKIMGPDEVMEDGVKTMIRGLRWSDDYQWTRARMNMTLRKSLGIPKTDKTLGPDLIDFAITVGLMRQEGGAGRSGKAKLFLTEEGWEFRGGKQQLDLKTVEKLSKTDNPFL